MMSKIHRNLFSGVQSTEAINAKELEHPASLAPTAKFWVGGHRRMGAVTYSGAFLKRRGFKALPRGPGFARMIQETLSTG